MTYLFQYFSVFKNKYWNYSCADIHYWVFGLRPSSDFLKNRDHNVSETGSVQRLKLALSKRSNRVGVSLSPEDGNRSNFRNVVFSKTRRWTKSRNQVILSVIQHHQSPLEFIFVTYLILTSPSYATCISSSHAKSRSHYPPIYSYVVFLISFLQIPRLKLCMYLSCPPVRASSLVHLILFALKPSSVFSEE
jgi:hypothetical protein